MTEYAFHPLAEMFPLMEGGEFAELVADIGANGLNEPVVLFEGMILDGRNRARACSEANVEPKYRAMEFGSWDIARAYVISANATRRHLTAEQKSKAIADLLKADPEKSDRQIAKEIGASNTHVSNTRRRLEQTGDVSTVDTSTDSKGRKQPRRRSKARKEPPAPEARREAEEAGDVETVSASIEPQDVGGAAAGPPPPSPDDPDASAAARKATYAAAEPAGSDQDNEALRARLARKDAEIKNLKAKVRDLTNKMSEWRRVVAAEKTIISPATTSKLRRSQ